MIEENEKIIIHARSIARMIVVTFLQGFLSMGILFLIILIFNYKKTAGIYPFYFMVSFSIAIVTGIIMALINASLSQFKKIELYDDRMILYRRYSLTHLELDFSTILNSYQRTNKLGKKIKVFIKPSGVIKIWNIGMADKDWDLLYMRLVLPFQK